VARTTTKKGPSSPDGKLRELAETKLQSSGLTLEDAKRLRITWVPGTKVRALSPAFKPLGSLRFDYLDPHGKPAQDWPEGPPYYRLRYLEADTSFDAVTDKKVTRYVQPPGTVPVAYYPASVAWPQLINDPDQPLIITEGELKAAKACKEGFPTIGLGGVWSWRSVGNGVTWLPSLEVVTWSRRHVYLCFDSDLRSNPSVSAALRELAAELQRRGAFCHLVNLPALPTVDKTGLDDFLVGAPNATQQFANLLQGAEPLGLTAVLWKLNEQYIYIKNPGLVLDQRTRFKAAPGAFRDHLEAPSIYQEGVYKDGVVQYKPVPAAAAWLRWPLRAEAGQLTYRPGQPTLIANGTLLFNIWPGWGVQPKKGDVKLFLQLIDHLFSSAEPAAKEWFLRWCAYPLQHPGVKMFTSAVLHGIRHGTGKSLVGYTLGRIYGENFTEITQNDLHSSFNEWAEGKQFVLGDDVTGSNRRQDADMLKKLITQRELRVNPKYVPSYVVPDCINYLFTSNHPDAFFLEDDDRRFFIHEVQVQPLPEEFYVEYDLWLDSGGSQAVFEHLLKLDLGDFNPAAPAFKTAAKERMIANVQSDLGAWCRQLIMNPDYVLKVGDIPIRKDLFTTKELLQLYDPIGKTGTTANGLGRELTRAGVRQVVHGKPVRVGDGSQSRFYAVRRIDHWMRASVGDVVKHIDDWNNGQQPKAAKY